MSVSLETAKSKVSALTGTGTFDAIKKNLTCHAAYHFDETLARQRVAGGQATACGFYVKYYMTRTEKNKSGTIEQEFNEARQGNPKYRKKWIAQPAVKNFLKVTIADDGGNLGYAGLSGSAVGYYRSSINPDNSFLRVVAMPDGYAGTSVVKGLADEHCPYLVVVIGASPTATSLITHYPAAQSWLDNQTALT